MPNKVNEYDDRAYTHVNSILTNKTNLSPTPDINLLLEEALRKIQYLDANYQKMAQDVEVLRLAVTQQEQEKVAYYRTISKLVVRDVIMAAKTKSSFQEVQEIQSRHDVALQHHQSKLTAHQKSMNKFKAGMKLNNECLVSYKESLEALKATQAQHSDRMDTTDEKFEDLISKMQMDERNARRRSRTGSQLEESTGVYREPSREELKQSLKGVHHNISLTRSYKQHEVDRPRLDSGVSIGTMRSAKSIELLSDECSTSSLPITSPAIDSGFNSLVTSQDTSLSQLDTSRGCDSFIPMKSISEATTDS